MASIDRVAVQRIIETALEEELRESGLTVLHMGEAPTQRDGEDAAGELDTGAQRLCQVLKLDLSPRERQKKTGRATTNPEPDVADLALEVLVVVDAAVQEKSGYALLQDVQRVCDVLDERTLRDAAPPPTVTATTHQVDLSRAAHEMDEPDEESGLSLAIVTVTGKVMRTGSESTREHPACD